MTNKFIPLVLVLTTIALVAAWFAPQKPDPNSIEGRRLKLEAESDALLYDKLQKLEDAEMAGILSDEFLRAYAVFTRDVEPHRHRKLAQSTWAKYEPQIRDQFRSEPISTVNLLSSLQSLHIRLPGLSKRIEMLKRELGYKIKIEFSLERIEDFQWLLQFYSSQNDLEASTNLFEQLRSHLEPNIERDYGYAYYWLKILNKREDVLEEKFGLWEEAEALANESGRLKDKMRSYYGVEFQPKGLIKNQPAGWMSYSTRRYLEKAERLKTD